MLGTSGQLRQATEACISGILLRIRASSCKCVIQKNKLEQKHKQDRMMRKVSEDLGVVLVEKFLKYYNIIYNAKTTIKNKLVSDHRQSKISVHLLSPQSCA